MTNSTLTWSTNSDPMLWNCQNCYVAYNWIDDQPLLHKRKERIDVTTFNGPQQFLVQEFTELYCKGCGTP